MLRSSIVFNLGDKFFLKYRDQATVKGMRESESLILPMIHFLEPTVITRSSFYFIFDILK